MAGLSSCTLLVIRPLGGDCLSSRCVGCRDSDAAHCGVSPQVCAGPPAVRSDPRVFLAQGSHSYWNAHSLGWGHFFNGYRPACGPLPVPRYSYFQAFVQAGPSIWNVHGQSPLIKLLSSFKAWHQKHLHQEGTPSLPSWNPFLPLPGLLFRNPPPPVKMTEIGTHAPSHQYVALWRTGAVNMKAGPSRNPETHGHSTSCRPHVPGSYRRLAVGLSPSVLLRDWGARKPQIRPEPGPDDSDPPQASAP